jgi:hypothetical protein
MLVDLFVPAALIGPTTVVVALLFESAVVNRFGISIPPIRIRLTAGDRNTRHKKITHGEIRNCYKGCNLTLHYSLATIL